MAKCKCGVWGGRYNKVTLKKNNTRKDLERMKQLTNQMCRERGLTVAEKGKHFDVIRGYLPVNLILIFGFINVGIMLLRMYLRKKFEYM